MNGAPPAAAGPAGFWIRFAAFLIDGVVILVVQLLLGVVAALRWGPEGDGPVSHQGAVALFTLAFAVAYPTVLHAVAGQTLGKLATGVRVVAVDGGALPLGASFLRAVAAWLSLVFTVGGGHVIGGLRKDKRALHDLVAGTRVDRVARAARRAPAPRPAPPAAPPPAPMSSPTSSPVPPLAPRGPFQRPVPPAPSEPRSIG